MNGRHIRWLVIVMVAGTLLAACSTQPVSPDPASASDRTPEVVVESFYNWYLDYSAAGNPLVDGAYQAREELDPRMVTRIDAAMTQAGGLRADPFLCAQDVPTYISVANEQVASDEALVSMESSFEGHRFKVKLVMIDEDWKIAEVMCGR